MPSNGYSSGRPGSRVVSRSSGGFPGPFPQGGPVMYGHPGMYPPGYGFGAPQFYRPRPAGPQLPFTKELLNTVPQENVGSTLPFLSEVVQKAQTFTHPLPSHPLPFLTELKDTKPAAPASDVPIQRYATTNKLSQAVVFNQTAYLAGVVPGDKSGDIVAQAKDVLDKIEFRLKELGSDKSRILSADIWLSSLKDLKGLNETWEAWLVPGTAPARACFEAKLQDNVKVEIKVIAAVI